MEDKERRRLRDAELSELRLLAARKEEENRKKQQELEILREWQQKKKKATMSKEAEITRLRAELATREKEKEKDRKCKHLELLRLKDVLEKREKEREQKVMEIEELKANMEEKKKEDEIKKLHIQIYKQQIKENSKNKEWKILVEEDKLRNEIAREKEEEKNKMLQKLKLQKKRDELKEKHIIQKKKKKMQILQILEKKNELNEEMKADLEDIEKELYKGFNIDKGQVPDWDSSSGWHDVERATKILFDSSCDNPLEIKKLIEEPITVQIKKTPFDAGTQRLAYYMKIVTSDGYNQWVVKEFKKSSIGMKKEVSVKMMEMQITCKLLAKKFNNARMITAKKTIDFLTVIVICLHREKTMYWMAEPYLSGKYEKFNNNKGWLSTTDSNATAQAFSHFTFHETKVLVVVDLQGVKQNTQYTLTDPAIHAMGKFEDQFGLTNFGEEGICDFFESHQCTKICEELHLVKHPKQTKPNIPQDTLLKF